MCTQFSRSIGKMWLKYVAARSVGTGHIPLLSLESCQVSLVLSCWLLQKWLGTLYYQCVDVRHMIQDCEQTVHHMLQCVLRGDLAGLVIPSQIIVEPCGLVGCCSLLLC